MPKISAPPGFKVPGAVWIILTVAGVVLAENYAPNPRTVDMIIMLVGLLLPLVVDNDGQLKQAREIIDILTRKPIVLSPGMVTEKGMRGLPTVAVEPVVPKPTPKVGHPVMRYLFG